MARGPRTPQGYAAVTRNIQRYNAERRNARQRSMGWGIDGIGQLQPDVWALAAQIIAIVDNAAQGIVRPTERAITKLLATALAITRLMQDEDLAGAAPALSDGSGPSSEVQDTGNVASVRGGGAGGEAT